MKGKKILAVAAVTVAALASMGTVYAAVGTQSDPLVTLSYLNNQFTASVLSQVDEKVEEQQETLKSQLEEQIRAFTENIQAQLGQGTPSSGTQTGTGSVYSVVTLANGQTLMGDIGCEVMLRVGSATCVTDSEPGLIDLTDGDILGSGKNLVKNHLYMMTIDGRGVKAGTDVKLLVRGTYTIQ